MALFALNIYVFIFIFISLSIAIQMSLIDLHFLELENFELEENFGDIYLYREMHGCILSLLFLNHLPICVHVH